MPVDSEKNVLVDSTPVWKRRRYFVALMGFLGYFNMYTMRTNLSVAIVSMTENRTIELEDGTQAYEQFYPWNSKEKGFILSAFFYGYVCTQILGGALTTFIGGNILFGTGILFTSLFTLLGPIMANLGLYAFIATRVLIGIFEGVTIPGIYQMWSKWVPPNERSRIIASTMAGNFTGIVTSTALSGLIIRTIGWPYTFYVFGIIGCFYSVLWFIFIRKTPAEDPFISEGERRFIEEAIGSSSVAQEKVKIPWFAVWTSVAVWANCFLNFFGGWGLFLLQTQLPQYLKDVFDYDITSSGLISALPFLSLAVMLQLSGQITDWVIMKGFLTKLQARRGFPCTTFLMDMTFIMLAAFLAHPVLSIVLITMGVAASSFIYANAFVNVIEIAPRFSAITYAVSNTFATIAGMISPLVTGFIVVDGSEFQWKIALGLGAFFYLTGSITYWLCVRVEVQPWAEIKDEEDNKKTSTYL